MVGPKCPYCGAEMSGYMREYGLALIQVRCTICGACGPTAEIRRRKPWESTSELRREEERKAAEAAWAYRVQPIGDGGDD